MVIGAYELTNGERSKYIYRCKTDIEGYFIRKEQWLDALFQNEIIAKKMKTNLFIDNYFKINLKLQSHKAKMLAQLQARSDIEVIKTLEKKTKLVEQVKNKLED